MNAETNILSMTDLQHTALISGNKAMQLLELSRTHSQFIDSFGGVFNAFACRL